MRIRRFFKKWAIALRIRRFFKKWAIALRIRRFFKKWAIALRIRRFTCSSASLSFGDFLGGRSSLIISTHNYPYITVCPSLQEVDQQNPSTVAANQGRF
ncbi:hypothetical protein [Dolichospermum sp. LEGE 00246]|uniref:hypothetical protein n=1 Tax=Dolichospermum sp. LEGE 00246 TaxID=1828605 RepID=UPI0018827075|nr:hypothetical protein [Dolichospermum sp. LEGE 00246]MBE9258290.1 hypothetical protein [Dolichospermum sp. LEGE 00246]